MRSFLSIILLVSIFHGVSGQSDPSDETIFRTPEAYPLFPLPGRPGEVADDKGLHQKAMLEYVYGNIVYPPIHRNSCSMIAGRIVVSFVVNEDGCLSDFAIVRGLEKHWDEEALRVLRSMPQPWIPGKFYGRPVRTQYLFPIRVRLE